MKKNSEKNYESIMVYLTPNKTPIAYKNRVKCLMSSGMSSEEAERFALGPIELELYYEVGSGLMAVESEAVEINRPISSSCTGKGYNVRIVCPNCYSENIQSRVMDINYNILKYECNECGKIFDADEAERR